MADIKGVQLSGLLAWMTWLAVHIFYLIGFQNRVLVLARWAVSFVTRGRSARLIVGMRPFPDANGMDGSDRVNALAATLPEGADR